MGWIIGIIVLVAIGIAVAGIYNNMVTLRNRIDNAWQNIDTQLQRRNDLIPNLVDRQGLCRAREGGAWRRGLRAQRRRIRLEPR